MSHLRTTRRPKPRGLTLIELLVVVFIMMIFVAAAAPLVNPATSDRKTREASRQINAYIAEAKAHAAQRNRPVGIAFDRLAAMKEGTRDANLVSRMYLVEVPPIYTGDTLTANVRYYCKQNDQAGAFAPPAIIVAGVVRPAIKLQLGFNQCPMLDSIIQSYIPLGGQLPFSLKLGGRGAYRTGYADYQVGRTPPVNYYLWVVYGDPMYSYCFQALNASPPTNFPVAGSIPQPQPDLPPPHTTYYYYTDTFQLALPPVPTGDSSLELPTGTVVDCQFSGYSASGSEFFDRTRSIPSPLIVLLTPGGSVGLVQNQGVLNNPAGRIFFLVGTRKTDTDSRNFTKDAGGFESYRNVNHSNPGDPPTNLSNVNDPSSLWVSINPQTGHVSTAENSIPNNVTDVASAVFQARRSAMKLNTKGGR